MTISARCVLNVAACCLMLATAAAEESYWNQFRGPHEDGTTTNRGLPVTFSEGSPEITWKTPIPGRGWSSPVIWKNQIWITNSTAIQNLTPEHPKLDRPIPLSVLCVDLDTGRVIHDRVLFEVSTPQFTHPTNSYASCTCYVEEGRVYVHFGAYGTACLDTKTFETLWSRDDMPCDHFRGPGSSPIVYGDLLYLTFDGYDYQYVTALDKHTGKTVWKTDRIVDPAVTDGDAKKGYSTPLLVSVEGRAMLVSPFASATTAYDPIKGTPLWTVKHGGMNAAARPLYGNGLLYINAADGPNPLMALRPEGTGDISKEIVWRSNKGVAKRSSQLLIDDLLFMMNDSGVATCLDAYKGDILWTKRFGSDYWASPIYADGLIYCCSQTGEIPVFKASRELEVVAENKLNDGFVASPAVAGSSLVLRSKTHLYRIDKVAGGQ